MDTYPRAVLTTAAQGLLAGAWSAAGELPASRRRLARAGSVLVVGAIAAIADREEEPEPMVRPEIDARGLAVAAGAVAISVGLAVQRRRLEKRWLAALIRDGHPHPHRAMAVRMGLLSIAGALPGQLIKVHEQRRPR